MNQRLPPASWRTLYFLIGFGTVPTLTAAQAGEFTEGVLAGVVVGPAAVGLMWALRSRWWFYNWWKAGGEADA